MKKKTKTKTSKKRFNPFAPKKGLASSKKIKSEYSPFKKIKDER